MLRKDGCQQLGQQPRRLCSPVRHQPAPSPGRGCCKQPCSQAPPSLRPARSHEWYKDKAFYYDGHHPDGNSGHRTISELLFHLVHETLHDLEDLPLEAGETERAKVGSTRAGG
jgi:hypothetical protein